LVLVPPPELPVCELVGAVGVGRVVAVLVDRLGSLVVGGGEGLLRTGTTDRVGGALVVVLVGAGRVVAVAGSFAGAGFFTTLALAFGLAVVRGGVFAFAGFAFAGLGFAAGLGAAAGGV
jgi:hypothetical protein